MQIIINQEYLPRI